MSINIRHIYDQIAPAYAERWREIPRSLIPTMEQLSVRAGSEGLVLDVGCGHGRDLAWFEQRNVRAIGIDVSAGMLREARRVTGVPLALMDMRRIAIRDSTVAAIWCCASLLHLPKAQSPLALAEFRRVLRPKGLAFIGVQQGSHDGPRYSHNDQVVRHFADYEPGEMARMVHGTGLRVIEQSSTEAGTVTWLQTLVEKS